MSVGVRSWSHDVLIMWAEATAGQETEQEGGNEEVADVYMPTAKVIEHAECGWIALLIHECLQNMVVLKYIRDIKSFLFSLYVCACLYVWVDVYGSVCECVHVCVSIWMRVYLYIRVKMNPISSSSGYVLFQVLYF